MQFRRLMSAGLTALVLAIFATPALAQYTTSSIAGVVTDDAGNAVGGAEVVVVHEPTGTRRSTMTQDGGRYRVSGLRIGGPYSITITKEGFSGDRATDVFVTLKDTYTLNVTMTEGAAELGTIEVTGQVAGGLFSPESKGTQTIITRDQIEALPTISRSLNDFVRSDPRAVIIDEGRGEISVAGQNNRYNNVTIDNVPANDEFGLEPGGIPSRGNVISIDAIAEIEVDVAPYDVSKSQFIGGGVNAVTKSGTNDIEGTVYYIYRDEDLINDSPNDFAEFEEKTYGFNVGGPIIEDTLFFFVSYEHFEQTQPGPDVGLQGSGAGTIFDLPQSEIDRVIAAANGFGYDPGGQVPPGELQDEDDLYLVKLDWNINDQHRAQFQFQRTEGTEAVIGGRSRTSYSLSSFWYNNEFERDSYVGLLYSDWTPNFSTEVNFSYAEFSKAPIPLGVRGPEVTIDTDAGDVLFGTESFRHANLLDTEVTSFYAAGEYLWGDHTIKFGFDYKENTFDNTFVFNSLGEYLFESIDDFENNIVSEYQLRIGSDPNDPFPAADWGYENWGIFIQDTWDLSYNFSLTYGVRADFPVVDDRPPFNPLFEETFGFRNDGTIDGNEVIQPRVGFNWDLSGDYAQQIRGGVGLFYGSTVGVWLSNPFTNPGGTVEVYDERGGEVFYTPDINNQPRPGGPLGARQDVDALDPNFEPPTVWRANLAYDRELPWGINMTLEVVHSETENDVQFKHLNLGDPTGNLPDGRLSYWCDTANASGGRCNSNDQFDDVLLLENTSQGSSTQWTVEFSKQWGFNLDTNIAYTVSRADAVNPGTSSRAISNWNNRATFNPNEETVGTANYEIQERIIGSLTWRHQFFEGLDTTVGLFYEGRSGRPFSFVFDNDANGDFIRDNDLIFVPSRPGEVVFVDRNGNPDPEGETSFFNLVNQNRCLREFSGRAVTRNHCKSEFTHQVDLRISQEIPLFWGARGEAFVNILNLGNLIDSDWGRISQVPFEYVAEVANYRGLTEDGRYQYEFTRDSFDFVVDGQAQSRWSAQLGFRVNF
ncbi:MAG: TonB-dependent receptor [Pseudomonadota bacterium]